MTIWHTPSVDHRPGLSRLSVVVGGDETDVVLVALAPGDPRHDGASGDDGPARIPVAGLGVGDLVTVYAIERDEGALFMAMEYLDGKTLAEVIPRGGLPLPRLLSLATQIVDALVAAHSRGVVHRETTGPAPGRARAADVRGL